MKKKFIADMVELKKIIDSNNAKGLKNGPIILGLYNRLQKIFK